MCRNSHLLVFLLVTLLPYCRSTNNVCSRWLDYLFAPFSANCWHDPDVGDSPRQIANRYGYNFELHRAVTDDGYQLGVFRISGKDQRKGVIFLQHGFLNNGMQWISIGRKSLAFVLADNGFDVWIGNFRGTIFSRGHSKKLSEKEYWDFSFYEFGHYDLPAMLDLAMKVTKTNGKIIYIGHSMGCAASFIYSITRKDKAQQQLSTLISLAPAVYYRNPFNEFSMLNPVFNVIVAVTPLFGYQHIGISSKKGEDLFRSICLNGPAAGLCKILAGLFFFLINNPVPSKMISIVLTQMPSGQSLNTWRHFAQFSERGNFERLDYGVVNLDKYGTLQPPLFDLTKIKVPVYLLYGKMDNIADESDIHLLYKHLTTTKYLIPVDGNVAHIDFIFSPEKAEVLQGHLLKIIGNFSNY